MYTYFTQTHIQCNSTIMSIYKVLPYFVILSTPHETLHIKMLAPFIIRHLVISCEGGCQLTLRREGLPLANPINTQVIIIREHTVTHSDTPNTH